MRAANWEPDATVSVMPCPSAARRGNRCRSPARERLDRRSRPSSRHCSRLAYRDASDLAGLRHFGGRRRFRRRPPTHHPSAAGRPAGFSPNDLRQAPLAGGVVGGDDRPIRLRRATGRSPVARIQSLFFPLGWALRRFRPDSPLERNRFRSSTIVRQEFIRRNDFRRLDFTLHSGRRLASVRWRGSSRRSAYRPLPRRSRRANRRSRSRRLAAPSGSRI